MPWNLHGFEALFDEVRRKLTQKHEIPTAEVLAAVAGRHPQVCDLQEDLPHTLQGDLGLSHGQG